MEIYYEGKRLNNLFYCSNVSGIKGKNIEDFKDGELFELLINSKFSEVEEFLSRIMCPIDDSQPRIIDGNSECIIRSKYGEILSIKTFLSYDYNTYVISLNDKTIKYGDVFGNSLSDELLRKHLCCVRVKSTSH